MAKSVKCEVELLLQLIGGRWKLLLLRELFEGPKRHAELRRAIPGISQKVLTQRLREMERHGIVFRRDYRSARPRVEYTLTEFGREMKRIILGLHRWAEAHADEIAAAHAGQRARVGKR